MSKNTHSPGLKRQSNQPIEELEKNLRSSANLKNQNVN